MDQADRIERIESGRAAAMASGIVGPFVATLEAELVDQLVGVYRGASVDHDKLLGLVGGIAALRLLTTMLEGEQRRGDAAAEREYAYG